MKKIISIFLFAIIVVIFNVPAKNASADCGEGQERCQCKGNIKCWYGPNKPINYPIDVVAPGACGPLSSALFDICQEDTAKKFNTATRNINCSSEPASGEVKMCKQL